MVVMTHAKDR